MNAVDYDDIQGLVRSGYGECPEARFLLLRVKNRDAARRWLREAPVTSVAMIARSSATSAAGRAAPDVLQVAFTSEGLRALGVADDVVGTFSAEFVSGMSGDDNRARRLGDVAANAAREWTWGAGERLPHVLLMLYAASDRIDAWQREIEAGLDAGFETIETLRAAPLRDDEPFGFKDGVSQPRLDWERKRPARDEDRFAYGNLACLGEVLLGYPNEYGGYTDRPLLDPARGADAALPRAEDEPGKLDLGRNGTYVVLRQLRQDVEGFARFSAAHPSGAGDLAEAMVGRTRQGVSLIDPADPRPADLNAFDYASDPDGVRCPVGAHVRRANPRNADLPGGRGSIASRLWRTLGFDADVLASDRVASARFHRLLRRGRRYGPEAPSGGSGETGLYFICLGANIARQFEFVQSAWLIGTKFDGLTAESDPIVGTRLPAPDGTRTDIYSMQRPDGAPEVVSGIPQFVTVRGGAYFFMPGLRALRYLAGS